MGSKGTKRNCPRCGQLVFVAGMLISYHPPCRAAAFDDVGPRYVCVEYVRWKSRTTELR